MECSRRALSFDMAFETSQKLAYFGTFLVRPAKYSYQWKPFAVPF